MKKHITSAIVVTLLCLGILAGCATQGSNNSAISASPQTNATTNQQVYTDAYNTLVAFKVEKYASKTVADFNATLTDESGDLTDILEKYSIVLTALPENDENYDFFQVTLDCSLDELYCEQLGDEVAFSRSVKKAARPITPLNDEEAYEFYFTARYAIYYAIPDRKAITIGERDTTLLTFQSDLQAYIGTLSEGELSAGNIRETLSKKVAEIAENLSTDKMALSCEIGYIEVHDSGADYQI